MAAERTLLVLLLVGGCVVEHKLGDIDLEDGGFPSGTGTSIGETSASGDASMSSTTAGDSTGGSESTSTGVLDPYAQCGVVLEYGGPNQMWTCGCALCQIDQEDLTEQSRDSFLGACECLCDALGCGGSTSVTTGNTTEDSSGGSSSGDEGTTSESTGAATETTTDTG